MAKLSSHNNLHQSSKLFKFCNFISRSSGRWNFNQQLRKLGTLLEISRLHICILRSSKKHLILRSIQSYSFQTHKFKFSPYSNAPHKFTSPILNCCINTLKRVYFLLCWHDVNSNTWVKRPVSFTLGVGVYARINF